ncbi:hydrogenase [Pendulispora brunnea]|uniref:Hydrogenase n=1 Tax=Pendulispora brunnea TaxID=2905690 RepID=A0ABZ2JYV5_9BACT
MALALVLVPLAFALLVIALPSNRWRPLCVSVGGAAHLALTLVALNLPEVTGLGGWLLLDPMARLVLLLTSTLFFLCSLYARGYLAFHSELSNRVFCACMLGFIGVLTLVVEAQHLGLMWVAIETTTLVSAPMLTFNRDRRSLEAAWKYLLIGSVGIALALLGSLFLAYSALRSGLTPSLLASDMVHDAPLLSRPWLRSAFVMLFIGYGTKMGLAPMHTWKPDAYGEAPGVVGTLLAGGLTNCAFLAILRFYAICISAGDSGFARDLMIVAGLLSMAVAGVFMARQKDIKRMLAYSSVEHMGILVLGMGIGGGAVFGSMLHMLNNGLTKGVLFLSAANVQRAYASKSTDEVRGALQRVPISGALMLAGFFAITGSPPFGPFLSEFTILNSAISEGRYLIAALFLGLLAVVFIGMGATVLTVVQGTPSERASVSTFRDGFSTAAPPLILMALVLLLGVYVPQPVETLVRNAASVFEFHAAVAEAP